MPPPVASSVPVLVTLLLELIVSVPPETLALTVAWLLNEARYVDGPLSLDRISLVDEVLVAEITLEHGARSAQTDRPGSREVEGRAAADQENIGIVASLNLTGIDDARTVDVEILCPEDRERAVLVQRQVVHRGAQVVERDHRGSRTRARDGHVGRAAVGHSAGRPVAGDIPVTGSTVPTGLRARHSGPRGPEQPWWPWRQALLAKAEEKRSDGPLLTPWVDSDESDIVTASTTIREAKGRGCHAGPWDYFFMDFSSSSSHRLASLRSRKSPDAASAFLRSGTTTSFFPRAASTRARVSTSSD